MVRYGETKNTVLIAINAVMIGGALQLSANTQNEYVYYYFLFIITMCVLSVIICSSALIAKIKHKPHEISQPLNDNPLFFATVAHMTHDELLDKLHKQYACSSENPVYEIDLAKQAIITSQIASRKFKLFNVAIAFTFCGMVTPIGLLLYKLFLQNEK